MIDENRVHEMPTYQRPKVGFQTAKKMVEKT